MKRKEELYQKHRPKTFKGMVGQEAAVKSLQSKVDKDKVPHAMLFSGPSGVGKTSAARILAGLVGSTDDDVREINAASSRGIDEIRNIEKAMKQYSLSGGTKTWIIDECFPAFTPVLTINGEKPIGRVDTSDWVLNILGMCQVEKAVKNRVSLDRITRIKLSNGKEIFTTTSHLFFTENGWIEACNLGIGCYLVSKETIYGNLQVLQEKIPPKAQLQELQTNLLQQIMSSKGQGLKTGAASKNVQRGSIKENKLRIEGNSEAILKKKNVRKQSNVRQKSSEEDDGNKKEERDIECLVGEEGREWATDRRTEDTLESARREAVEDGTDNKNRNEESIPPQLQSGYRQEEVQDSGGSRWENPQVEKAFIARQKERECLKIVRVESIEIYKQGDNDESFRGVINDTDRTRGFTEFYDLTIKGHPSYFAQGVAVHNCHKLTSDAMNAILKPLEEPPDDVYFILASSIPNKLLKTIISRCTEVKFKAFTPKEIETLVRRIAKKEGKEVSDDVMAKIVELAEGNGRKAIVLLEQTIDEDDEAEKLKLLMATESEEIGIQICRRLMDFKMPAKVKWIRLVPLLWKVQQWGDAEEIRRSVLGYARKVMLGDSWGGGRAARCNLIINVFRDHFFDCGNAGLCAACYEVCNEK